LRFVTWNLGRSRRTHDAAWHYLLYCLKPDIALVQEALASATRLVAFFGTIVWSKSRPGGTGVVVRHGIPFEQFEAFVKGSYVAAVSTSVMGKSTRAFSVHVGPEKWANQEALEPWLAIRAQEAPCVIGGDFNTSRAYSRKHEAYLNRLSVVGLHDCHWIKHGREVPSFWGRQSRAAKYQDDHFFTSRSLAGFVHDCSVVDNSLTRLLSDHGPVTLDLKSGLS
jgi:endonuclease/exonuclease/phosphatase family metal-dependent hydrolase